MTSDGRGRVRTEPGTKRVRAVLGGQVVADTLHPLMVWEVPYYPTYYVPVDDVRTEYLVETGRSAHSPSRGDADVCTLRVGDAEASDAALRYRDSPLEALNGHVRLEFAAMDAWFEEDEEIFVHPRDPHTRVDILAASRHVRIEIDGVTVAETRSPRLLFETGLPTRYYLPKTDVRLDLLEPSETVTHCPYKGSAEYYSVRVGDTLHRDVVWYYRTPLPESQKVQGLLAFYDEKVDVFLDGVKQERPTARF